MNNYIITQAQLEQLSRIYNTFIEVPVRGEGAFLHVDALRALQQVINTVSQQPEAKPEAENE